MINHLPDSKGVFPTQALRQAVELGVIESPGWPIPEHLFQPASLDLRLGESAYRLRCSILPGSQTMDEKLSAYALDEIDLRNGAILERNRPYLIPLLERLRLPSNLRARANPKSSTGRLDIFTRLVTECSFSFNDVSPGYEGGLFLEVVPRSFTVKVKTGVSLSQLRLLVGSPSLTDADILNLHQASPVVLPSDGDGDELTIANGLFLSVDLNGSHAMVVGYRAKKNSDVVDLSMVGHYPTESFWEPLVAGAMRQLVLEPEEFYIFASAETIAIPPTVAAELSPYDPSMGELRTHYAGFFDPGFGIGLQAKGARAVMEVRPHDVPFLIEHRQRICRLVFEWMAEPPQKLYGQHIGSSYQHQGLELGKHFRSRAHQMSQMPLL